MRNTFDLIVENEETSLGFVKTKNIRKFELPNGSYRFAHEGDGKKQTPQIWLEQIVSSTGVDRVLCQQRIF